ncbi:response regulator [Sediminibacterium ginsengisoli]|uniref:Response regulator receiver domain-containing protein n=1 Tax=Sediminibacterium ginsengisoli TaxID=413434 RepID=A0A1T4KC70_9BACT|nr:response regulator [Sediminibacterium ginsengisoli]SJZ40048.1 Response regulator receiver domain-containing protein [Sediminibacterium ginsengisoli]
MTKAIHSILLADDDEDDRLIFLEALQDVAGGLQLTTVSGGEQLMELLQQEPPFRPDLLFLDLNMPCKNGYECLQEIKNSDDLKKIPVIIFSTSLQPKSIEHVYQHGAALYIVKPVSFSDLRHMLEKVLAMDWQQMSEQLPLDQFIIKN